MGTMSIITGLSLVLTGGLTKPLMIEEFSWLGSGRLAGVPVPLALMLAVYASLSWVLSRMRFGRFVYAAGSNPEASRLVGVPVPRTLMWLYVMSGLSGALSGLILAAMLGAAAPDAAAEKTGAAQDDGGDYGEQVLPGRGTLWYSVAERTNYQIHRQHEVRAVVKTGCGLSGVKTRPLRHHGS